MFNLPGLTGEVIFDGIYNNFEAIWKDVIKLT